MTKKKRYDVKLELIKKQLKILDIDLDFFLNKKHTSIPTGRERLDSDEYVPWSEEKVREYLENKAGLRRDTPVRGKLFTKHDEVFFYLKSLQEFTEFQLTFEIDHIDAHADLGYGDSGYHYIAAEVLSWPVAERPYLDRIGGSNGLNEGNYLLFLIACRWLTKLHYINHYGWTDDIPPFAFKNFHINSGFIQLKQFHEDHLHQMLYGRGLIETAKKIKPLAIEPPVAFKRVNASRFKSAGDYDLVFLTHSPYYTPESADALIPVITSYMSLV